MPGLFFLERRKFGCAAASVRGAAARFSLKNISLKDENLENT